MYVNSPGGSVTAGQRSYPFLVSLHASTRHHCATMRKIDHVKLLSSISASEAGVCITELQRSCFCYYVNAFLQVQAVNLEVLLSWRMPAFICNGPCRHGGV